MTLLRRRYLRVLSTALSSDYRERRWNYPERGIETTPLGEDNRHVKVVRATSLSPCVLHGGPEPAKQFYEKSWSEKLTILSRTAVSRRDRSFHEAHNWKSRLTCDSQTTVTYLCRVRVLPTSLPMKQWGSAENREGVARRATLVDMPAPAQPLIIYQAPRASLVGLPRTTHRGRVRFRTRRMARVGGSEKKEATLACLLVFVRDCSVHVKHGPPTCRLEMKLAFTCKGVSHTLSTSVTFTPLRAPPPREGDFRDENYFS